MTHSENDILAWFKAQNFPLDLVRHNATATAAEGRAMRKDLPGLHSKSLLVTDKDEKLTLIMARSEIRADLKGLGKMLGSRGRFSFASGPKMEAVLGVSPGHLSPMALINDADGVVDQVVIDKGLSLGDPIWCHPLHNQASIGISAAAVLAFVSAFGPNPVIIDAEHPAPI